MKFIICYTPIKTLAEKIIFTILKKKLSTCISITKNIQFIYIYKKNICKEYEYKIIITSNNITENIIIKYIKQIKLCNIINIIKIN